MPKITAPSRGQLLFALVLVLAAGLRFVHLGTAALSEYEATAALNAKALAEGQPASLGSEPAYVLLTSLLFRLLGTGNALARMWPALAGLAVVALPYAWREHLGHKTALLFSLFLALDPGLVALARLAGGPSLALAASLWAACCLLRGQALAGGILAASALLAGPLAWVGLGAGLLAGLGSKARLPLFAWRTAAAGFAGTLLLGGTALLRAPEGLSGLGQGQAALLWGLPGVTPHNLGEILFALVGYGLPALLLGLPQLLRQARGTGSRQAALFAAAALLLTVLLPNRQVAYLVWVLLPLYGLAAAEVSHFLQRPEGESRATYGEFILIVLLLPFLAFSMARASGQDYILYFEPGRLVPVVNPAALLPLLVALVAVAATSLVALGWSGQAARQGLTLALALAATLGLLAAGARYARQQAVLTHELWQPGPASANLEPLLDTVADLSFWNASQPNALRLDLRQPSAALRWALREYPQAGAGSTPALAIGPAGVEPAEFAAYRGQSFAWQTQRDWQAWPANLYGWLLFRQGPQTNQEIILWVRSDLFFDGDATQQNLNEANP